MKLLYKHEVDYIYDNTDSYKKFLGDRASALVEHNGCDVVVHIELSETLSVELCKWDRLKRTAFGNMRCYSWQFRPMEFNLAVDNNDFMRESK